MSDEFHTRHSSLTTCVIGVFDSGVGGLSVWREIVKFTPNTPIVYLADQAHVPYGARSLEEVRALTLRCTRWMIKHGCEIVVIACNTASGAALEALREAFPNTPIVGMEPAIKPAALHTETGVIGVLATPATFKSQRYSDLIARFGNGLTVIEQPCKGWVEAVEGLGIGDYELSTSTAISNLQLLIPNCVTPLLDQDADVLVLGCTHFPFLRPWIERAIHDWRARHPQAQDIALIDPAPAVAQQTLRVWSHHTAFIGLSSEAKELSGLTHQELWTTGSAASFARVASTLLDQNIYAQSVQP